MALYTYVKHQRSSLRTIVLGFSYLCITSGVILLFWVAYPILSFEFFYAPKFNALIKPVPNESTIKKTPTHDIAAVLAATVTDYTKASAWFPKAIDVKMNSVGATYTLSIPKLGISDAMVKVGSEDLDLSLVHFTGPLPGNYGNPIIFGHSTLPFLYDPTNYKTIFTKLPSLVSGDTINIKVDNVTYQFKIADMNIVSPDSVSVLEQKYDLPYLTLITCVPPGTYLKRLVVTAKLEKI